MLKHKIGLVYVPGALPCFEAFGRLPTNTVSQDGKVGNETASEALDMIIIPGGSLVESGTIKGKLEQEIVKMADLGKIVLGICSGFQVLANGTDIGRLSATPMIRKGLGLIDAEVSPLICTDQVKATIIGESSLTDKIGKEVKGFHCHTYGKIVAHKNARPILISHPKRVNYFTEIKELTSGVVNQKGNVIGVFLHGLLDKNPLIIEGITKSLDITSEELKEVRDQNAKLQEQMKKEIGILTNVKPKSTNSAETKATKTLLITALGSESGKTFFTTGLAGVLKKQGIDVGVLKVGGDIRDSVPALYLIKEPMRDFSSIKINRSGWMDPVEAITQASKKYEFVIVEGAMSAFTGMLITQGQRPFSTAEVAIALGIPTVVIAGCTKEGIEGGIISSVNYVKLLKSLGANVAGVVLNKVHISYLSQEMRIQIERSFDNLSVKLLGFIPRVDVEGRGAIPEIEIKYEEFCAKAIETIESNINLDNVLSIAKPAKPVSLDYEKIFKKFRKSIFLDCDSGIES